MFMTAKIPWKQLAAVLTLTAAFALCLLAGGDPAKTDSAEVPTEKEICLSYLKELGWEVTDKTSSDQILLPETFGSEFDEFLELQKQGGFSLESHAGQTVTRCTFQLANYPTGDETVYADLLVLEGQIIGGEIRSSAIDGFMTALTAQSEAG